MLTHAAPGEKNKDHKEVVDTPGIDSPSNRGNLKQQEGQPLGPVFRGGGDEVGPPDAFSPKTPLRLRAGRFVRGILMIQVFREDDSKTLTDDRHFRSGRSSEGTTFFRVILPHLLMPPLH